MKTFIILVRAEVKANTETEAYEYLATLLYDFVDAQSEQLESMIVLTEYLD